MIEPRVVSLVAECPWSRLTPGPTCRRTVGARARGGGGAPAGADIRYVGSILLRADEVVFGVFEGSAHAAARRA